MRFSIYLGQRGKNFLLQISLHEDKSDNLVSIALVSKFQFGGSKMVRKICGPTTGTRTALGFMSGAVRPYVRNFLCLLWIMSTQGSSTPER